MLEAGTYYCGGRDVTNLCRALCCSGVLLDLCKRKHFFLNCWVSGSVVACFPEEPQRVKNCSQLNIESCSATEVEAKQRLNCGRMCWGGQAAGEPGWQVRGNSPSGTSDQSHPTRTQESQCPEPRLSCSGRTLPAPGRE